MEFPKAGSGPNRKQIIDALRNTAQSASNMVAENASMPVDALAWALRKMGVPVGDKPVMGSDWMREKGLTAPTQEGASKVVGDTIGMISPMGFTKQGAQAMIDAGSKLKGLPVGMSIKDVSGPQSQALMLAQQRAALPVEQGGLGLAASNTAAERAAAMGFDTPAYHGTNRDFSAFSNQMLGANTGAKSAKGAHFAASSPDTANSYVKSGAFVKDDAPALEALFKKPGAWDEYSNAPTNQDRWAVLEKYGLSHGQGRVIPLQLNMQKPRIKDYKGEVYRDTTYAEEIAAAKKGKKDSVIFKSTYDGGGESQAGMSDIFAVMSPDQIRSRFAAFDPFRKTAATAALMGVAAPDLLAQERDNGNR
jgi:hypothetical protein